MNRLSWKLLLIGGVMALVLSTEATQANAQWWGWYRPVGWSCGYWPCYSCYTPCTVGCAPCGDCGGWYAGWRPGPVRRLLFGRYRWYWGPSGWCCGTTYESCCDGTTSSAAPTPAGQPTPAKKPVGEAPVPIVPEPAAPVPTPVMPEPQPAQPTTSGISAETSGSLTVWVPNDAKVTVNGLETRSTGSRRQFVSYGLKPGYSYKYVVHATIVRDGQVREDIRTVILTAGQITSVAFGFNAATSEGLALAR